MTQPFFRPREQSRLARWLFAIYAGVGLLAGLAVASRLSFPEGWLWALVGGTLAWGALRQGLTVVVEGWILSLEVGVYLFIFLVVGTWPALVAILVCSVLSMVVGAAVSPSDRHLDFCLRKMANTFVIGAAFLGAITAYWAAGGERPLVALLGKEAAALTLFWVVFTLVNNVLFWPIDVGREGSFQGVRLAQEMGLDGTVHALGVLSGSGFALLFNRVGIGPLLLLLPVYVLLVVFLKRVTDQETRLNIQQDLLRRLNEKGILLHSSLDLNEVLEAVGSAERELFGGDVHFVALFDERSGKIQFARAVDRGEPMVIEDFDPGEGLTGLVLRTGEPLFSGDVRREDRLKPHMKPFGEDAHEVRSVMLGPLLDKGRIIGVFSVQSNTQEAFKPFHRELFLAFLQQVSTAVVAARLYKRATEDGLTRLYNRSYLDERIRTCLQDGTPFGLVFIDCDYFKAINDRHGHPLGDRYLAALAQEIAKQSRTGDVPSRFGGDEFAVLLPGVGPGQARKVAERILAAVDALKIPVGEEGVGTTVSIGVLWSGGVREAIPVEDVFQKVDAALYEAKRSRHAIVETAL